MGAPKATETPAAAAADSTSRFRAVTISPRNLVKDHEKYLRYD